MEFLVRVFKLEFIELLMICKIDSSVFLSYLSKKFIITISNSLQLLSNFLMLSSICLEIALATSVGVANLFQAT